METVASASNTLKWKIQDASEILSETVSDAVASASDNFAVRVSLPSARPRRTLLLSAAKRKRSHSHLQQPT